MTDPDLSELAPLANVIAETLRTTPVRHGPGGAADLICQLTINTAAYMGSELPATPGLAGHMAEVDAERQRQLAKFGDQRHPDGTGLPIYRHSANRYRDHADRAAASGVLAWRDVLLEEVHEALAESDPAALRAELVQCAAVIHAWIHDLDGREAQR
ncbi:NUDIX hydrolase [Streptomyces violascens]|uniref:NUDIX hydrolase n=1 Tax=Streptomyces violascens TaxID=67381 RepID=UPI0036BD29D0